jgi:hypothetical protein
LLERLATNQKVAGSSPAERTTEIPANHERLRLREPLRAKADHLGLQSYPPSDQPEQDLRPSTSWRTDPSPPPRCVAVRERRRSWLLPGPHFDPPVGSCRAGLNPLLLASLVSHVTFLVLSAFVTRVLYYSTPTWFSELHIKVYRLCSFVCNNYSLVVTETVGEGCSYRPFASQYCGYRFLWERSSSGSERNVG